MYIHRSYGGTFLGIKGEGGPTVGFTFSQTSTDQEQDVTIDQSTNTGTQRLTVDPAAGMCYEINSFMDKATQRGRSQLRAVFTGWVGFHDHPAA
jgi:hypothetical protein